MQPNPLLQKSAGIVVQAVLLTAFVLGLSHWLNPPQVPVGQPGIALLLKDRPRQAAPPQPRRPVVEPSPAVPAMTDPAPEPAAGDPLGDLQSAAPAPGPQPPQTPWHEAVWPHQPPPPFADVCWEDFNTAKVLPKREDLEQWLARVDGQPYNFKDAWTPLGVCNQIEGNMRLNMPWRTGMGLRLGLRDFHQFQIHLFDDENGITLAFYQHDRDLWAAYQTTRRPRQPRPETLVLAATDQTRAHRTEIQHRGVVTIWHHAGEIWLTRGDIVLLRAPLPRPPEDVYLDGKATVFGIAAVRAGDFPESPEHPAVFETDRPADLAWAANLPESSRFERLPDGSIELSATAAGDAGWVATPIPQQGLTEVIFEVDSATAGAGVYLGRGEERPSESVRFLRDRRSGQLCVSMRDGDAHDHDFGSLRDHPIPFASPRQWIRILFATASARWWISADGRNWAAAEMPWSYRPGGVTHLGLHHVAGRADSRIRLCSLHVRRLPEWSSLVDDGLYQQTLSDDMTPLTKPASLEQWHAHAVATLPAGASLDDWRWACAARTLSQGNSRTVELQLIERLLDDAQRRGLPLRQQLRMLDEAALLLDIRDDHGQLMKLVQRYHALAGEIATQEGRHGAFSIARHALMNASLLTHYDIPILERRLAREEIIRCVARSEWDALWQLCQQLDFFVYRQHIPLAPWAQTLAARRLPNQVTTELTLKRVSHWRHPLVEEVSKETYNALVELQSVLDSGDVAEAARQISSLDAETLRGVSPMVKDRRLLVSLPSAMEMLFAEYPALPKLLREEYGELAKVRVTQATRDYQASTVRLATVQFAQTEAAALAHRWLGDAALSRGWFVQALSHYEQSAQIGTTDQQQEAQPRIRLASAMLGRDTGTPIGQSVTLGDFQMTAGEFEAMVRDLLRQRQPHDLANASGRSAVAPAPTGFAVNRRGRLDGPSGKEPKSEAIPRCREYNLDWAGRQLAVASDDRLMYVSNRFHVAAYDVADGSRKWQCQTPGGEPLRSQDWGLTRMRPLLAGERMYVRLLGEKGPRLVCLNRTDGQIVWQADQEAHALVVADPLILQGQLTACTVRRLSQGVSQLQLSTFDAATGRIVQSYDLVQLEEVWWRRRFCEAIPAKDGLIIALGGLTLACDAQGNLRWIRKHDVLPPDEEPHWVRQGYDRPLLSADSLFVLQPGMAQIERMDVPSGALRWSVTMPDAQRIDSLHQGVLILQTAQGLCGLDAETGDTRWTHPVENLLEAFARSDEFILASHAEPTDPDRSQYRIRLSWFQVADGKPAATTTLAGLDDANPKFGPLVQSGDRLWAFHGRGHEDPNRDLIQLTAAGQPDPVEASDADAGIWPP